MSRKSLRTPNEAPPASLELFNRVRAGFMMQGTSLKQWCEANDIDRGTATYALKTATRNGAPVALRKRLIEAAKVAA